ncbi:hypothetical protein Dsin_032399 [Dipteronia sinensis]|uniref:Uncharacterized protein n=1 Tax=Dipteronia sinensis TaxID=43782 RepID=A0AAD9ZNR3_9ROSI|nr:hypothetical protein Dsin_032399 [Dipteronia sinensis]
MMDIVQITSKKLIKPSVPTPIHLQNMRLSFMDQFTFPTTVPVIFYYPASNITVERQTNWRNRSSVDGQFSQILQGRVDAKELNQLVPDQVEESATNPLLAIQVSIFNCGGLTIGLRFSHRIMDAFTLFLFVKGWAKTCKVGIMNEVISPNFDSGIRFPTRDHVSGQKPPTSSKTRPQVVTKRFVFDAKAISKLKAEQALGSCYQFSVVELTIALIWRAQINAARARYEHLRSSLLLLPMNLRDEDEFFSKVIPKPGREIIEEFTKGNGDLRTFTSWRNLDMYEVDFGWGKPAWVSVAERPYGGIFLMDRNGGDGIEAWVTMDEQEMPFLQQDPHIANFIST